MICSSTDQLAPVSFGIDQEQILTSDNLKKAKEIVQGAENSIQGIAPGITGLGNILSVVAHSGELDPADTWRIGWLLSVLGESLDGFLFVGNEAEYFIRESKRRTAKQEQ